MIFFVPGIPKPGGSKRAFFNRSTGKAQIVDASGKPGKDWRSDCKAFAMQAMQNLPLLEGPLVLTVCFYMPRPKGHFGTGKNSSKLKDSAPSFHTSKPDTSKLLRSLEDALTGILWKDDAQIAMQLGIKIYRKRPGAHVSVRRIMGTNFIRQIDAGILDCLSLNVNWADSAGDGVANSLDMAVRM